VAHWLRLLQKVDSSIMQLLLPLEESNQYGRILN
jgi:hypothetical protein